MGARNADVIARLRDQIEAIQSGGSALKDVSGQCDSGSSSHGLSPFWDGSKQNEGELETSSRASRVDADNGCASDKEEGFSKICRLVNVRERCSKELHDRLVRDGFPEDVARAAVGRAVRCGLVDDERFADTLVRSRLSQGKGIEGIRRELQGFGIDACSVEALQSFSDGHAHDREVSRAVDLLRRKPPRSKNPRASAYRRLMTKGYSSSVAADASRMWWEAELDRNACD